MTLRMRLAILLWTPAIFGLVLWAIMQHKEPPFRTVEADVFLIDPATGCQYIVYHGGPTPRLDRNGRQICEPVDSGD